MPFCGELIVKNHKLLYISKYKNGSLNYERKVFYENGQKAIETFYKNDIEQGHSVVLT